MNLLRSTARQRSKLHIFEARLLVDAFLSHATCSVYMQQWTKKQYEALWLERYVRHFYWTLRHFQLTEFSKHCCTYFRAACYTAICGWSMAWTLQIILDPKYTRQSIFVYLLLEVLWLIQMLYPCNPALKEVSKKRRLAAFTYCPCPLYSTSSRAKQETDWWSYSNHDIDDVHLKRTDRHGKVNESQVLECRR